MDAAETRRRQSNCDAIAAYFKEHPNRWIPAATLAQIGGVLAWRTRVSDCRQKFGMFIENRQERLELSDGGFAVESSYRYRPHAPIGPSSEVYRERSLFEGDPTGDRR